MNFADRVSSFYKNNLAYIPAYWREQQSLGSGFTEMMDLVDESINESMRSSNESLQALVGVGMGTARVIGSIPLGLNDWALSVIKEIPKGPGKTLYRLVEVPISGIINGVKFLGNQSVAWSHGSLNDKNCFEVGQELSFTLGNGLLMFLGARGLVKGGNSINLRLPPLRLVPQLAGSVVLEHPATAIRFPTLISTPVFTIWHKSKLEMVSRPKTVTELINSHDSSNPLSIYERVILQQRLKLFKENMLNDFFKKVIPERIKLLLNDSEKVNDVITNLKKFNELDMDDWVYFKTSTGLSMKIRISVKGSLRIPVGFQLREL